MKIFHNTIFLLAILMFSCQPISMSFAEDMQDLIKNTIAVEQLIGYGEENVFAGIVGSLSFIESRNEICIAEMESQGFKVAVRIVVFDVTRLEIHEDYVDFSCIDSAGFDWFGKIWKLDGTNKSLGVEVVRKDAPRLWSNISSEGKKFLQDNNLTHVDLGL